MGWFRERFQTEFVITGKPQRDVIWEYPLDAVREALINAICHRDYKVNTNIQVRLYDDRLEIWNPGGLPTGLTAEDLLREHDSLPRNRLLADCLFYCGLIENWGSGTTRMASSLADANFPLPEFQVYSSNKFRVIFRKSLSDDHLNNLGLGSRQMQLLFLLKSGQQSITNEQYQTEFAVSKSTASRELRELVQKNILLKYGKTGKGTYYKLPLAFT
jgi:ATP-dependent DNA helicase RecG